jgi:RNA polymerase sigma factor (sigma-70 family)
MGTPLLFLNQEAGFLERIRKGEEQALVSLFHANRRAVTALVVRNSGSALDAEEILQESLVILWERVRAGTFEPEARIETFVYATARNLWLRRLARSRKEVPSELDPEGSPSADPSPLEQMIESQEADLVARALRRLGEPCRSLLVLFYWEGTSMEEIARRLGLANAESAKSKKYQCKKALRTILREFVPDHER